MLEEKEMLKLFEKEFGAVAQEELKEMMENGGKPHLHNLLEKLLNKLMIAEREEFLKRNEDMGNGYYKRGLRTSMGELELNVPRTRTNGFRSLFLPDYYVRGEESYNNLLEALITVGYSPSKLRNILLSLGISYSAEVVDRIIKELKEEYNDFVKRELPEEVFAVYIDGYKTKLKRRDGLRVENVTIYSVIGIDFEWKKDLYGFYIFEGNENKSDWKKVFEDLISRGMKKVDIIISDDFSGIDSAIKDIFPYSEHQLCITHMKRNITKHMSREDAEEFKNEFDIIKNTKDYEKAKNMFSKLLIKYKDRYKSFISYMWKKRELFLSFIKYPEGVRKFIYTTNIAENFNRRIEMIRVRLSGYFQSEDILGINIILQLKSLRKGKWSKPHPILKGKQYELIQKHYLKYADVYDVKTDTVSSALKEMNEFINNNSSKRSA
jgi:putative transposase